MTSIVPVRLISIVAPARKRHILDQAVVTVEPRIVHKYVDASAEKVRRAHCFFDAIFVANVRP